MDREIFLPMITREGVAPTGFIDLRLAMATGGASSVIPGGTLTYTLSFVNSGDHAATGVYLLETLPANTAFDSVQSSAGWNQVGSTSQYRLELGTLTAGQHGSVFFAVVVSAAPPAGVISLTNQASIQDDGNNGADPTPSNNMAGKTTAINFAPDLAVTVSGESMASAGTVTAFTVQYSNLGYNVAEGVVITETLPENTSYDPADNSVNWVLIGEGQYEYVVGSLAKGASGTLAFNVRVNQTVPSGTTAITDLVTISDDHASGSDPNPANNSATFATPLATGPTYTCGDITSDTHWTILASPYVLTCGVTVLPDATLTIEHGVVVKFQGTTSIVVNGSLDAQGTQDQPVTFTSLLDDSVAGDTNGDGSATSPAAGDWNSLIVSAGGTLEMTRAAVRYGGFYWCGVNCYGNNAAVYIYDGGNVTLDHATLAHNGGYGVTVNPSATSKLTVAHSNIETSGLNGIYASGIAGNQIAITDNVFTGNTNEAVYLAFSGGSVANLAGNSGSGNGINGILLTGALGMDTTLAGNPDFAYVIYGVTVNNGSTLTLQPGAVAKFRESTNGTLAVNGNLVVPGTEASPATFTSLQDDSAAGDTNNNGTATSPVPGDWNSIVVAPGATANLVYAYVRYGGYYWCGVNCYGENAALHVYDEGRLTLDHVNIAHSSGNGVAVNPSATSQLTVTDSAVGTSGAYGIYASGISGNQITLTDNVFTGNASEAVYLAFSGGSVADLAGNSGSGNGVNGILLTGSLGMDTTLPGNPDFAYVIYGVTVNNGSTLTLQPGAVAKFRESTNGTLLVNGSLNVPGTADAGVTFTSLQDDTTAGDTNNNGSATGPAAGDWNSVIVAATGTVNMAHSNLRYGGYYWCGVNCYGDNATLHVYDEGSLTLDHVNIAHSGGHGVAVNPSATSQLTVTHSIIGTSGLNGIYASGISGNQIALTDNVFTGNVNEAVYLAFSGGSVADLAGNTGSGNGVNGILLTGSLGIDASLAGNPDFAYLIYGLTVNSGSTLTVMPGAVVKFRESTNGTLAVNGNLNVPGSAESMVTFTSLQDDTAAGDTNNNGSATSPAAGDWNSIVVTAGGSTTMAYADLRYGGFYWCGVNCYGYDAMLVLQDSATASLQHSVFRYSPGAVIQASAGSSTTTLTVEYSVIGNPAATGIRLSASGTYVVAAHHNNIIGNSNYGIYNASTSAVDAVNNWWGSASGPGSSVYGLVNFTPWLTAPESLP